MGYTPSSPFGQLVWQDLQPWQTDHLGWLVDAIGSMFDPIWSIVSEQGVDGQAGFLPGYGVLFDVDSCPASGLGYLGQFVGVSIPDGSSEATARQLVTNKAGFQRGTPGAIIAAAQQWLTGTQTVRMFERTAANGSTDAYHFVLAVSPAELVDSAKLTAAVDAVRPGGVQWTLVVSSTFTWNQAIHTWSADAFSWSAADTTQP